MGGKTQRYIHTTLISSGFKTTDLVERKLLKHFEQQNDMIRFALRKITQAATLGKAGGESNLGGRIQDITKPWVLDEKTESSQEAGRQG